LSAQTNGTMVMVIWQYSNTWIMKSYGQQAVKLQTNPSHNFSSHFGMSVLVKPGKHACQSNPQTTFKSCILQIPVMNSKHHSKADGKIVPNCHFFKIETWVKIIAFFDLPMFYYLVCALNTLFSLVFL